ncbi:MAG: TonB family protein [Thermoanaerobaculia bacterium]|nr:TonB family protein [Thermoanaerobaculia bacterium]
MDTTVERVLAQRAKTADFQALWLRPASLALVVHLALAGAAVVAAYWPRKPPPVVEYVAVQVLPAPARGERRPPAPRPAAPKPEVKPPEPKPETKPEPVAPPEPKPTAPVPSPVKPPVKPTTPAPSPKPETKPTPPASSPAVAETPPQPPTPPAGTPEGTASGTSRLGYQVLGFEGSTFPFAYYLEQVLNKVDDQWTRPPVEGPKALVFFRILRDGRVVDLEIKESSGNRAFDLSALRAVTNASPLPPLPAGYREPTLSVHLIVR